MEREKRQVCAECGELLTSSTKFCPNCGSSKRRVFVVARDTVQTFSGIIEDAKAQLGKIERPLKKRKHAH